LLSKIDQQCSLDIFNKQARQKKYQAVCKHDLGIEAEPHQQFCKHDHRVEEYHQYGFCKPDLAAKEGYRHQAMEKDHT
jgi:hypothetical protein